MNLPGFSAENALSQNTTRSYRLVGSFAALQKGGHVAPQMRRTWSAHGRVYYWYDAYGRMCVGIEDYDNQRSAFVGCS